MPQFNVIVTRDATESTIVDVVAATEGEARDAALADLRANPCGLTWSPDDCSGAMSEPYVTGADLADARKPAENDPDGQCRHCGRDNSGHEGEPCSDDCPLYWEEAGIPHPDHINA